LLAVAELALPSRAAAHHYFAAHFQMDRMIEVEGRVTGVQWGNPHIKIHIEDANGQAWEVEAGPVNLLTRMGISRDKFVAADAVRVRGNPGRDDSRVIWVSNILLSDRTEILANPRAEPYWGASAVGDASAFFAAGESRRGLRGARHAVRHGEPVSNRARRSRRPRRHPHRGLRPRKDGLAHAPAGRLRSRRRSAIPSPTSKVAR
jgi:hypothetical protein